MTDRRIRKWIAVLLVGLLLAVTGCTARNNIVSVDEEVSSQYSAEEGDGSRDTLLKVKEPEDTLSEEAAGEPEPIAMTESEAKNLALSAAMRSSDHAGMEVDQTSVKILDQDEDVYYVSVNRSGGAEVYRVDKDSREVTDLDGRPVAGADDLPENEDSPLDDSTAIIEDEGY